MLRYSRFAIPGALFLLVMALFAAGLLFSQAAHARPLAGRSIPPQSALGKPGSAPWTVAPWPMFGHDPQHTGSSPANGPNTADLTWVVTNQISSGVVVGPDGTLY